MPLGWHITVYRQRDGGAGPSKFGDEPGERVAVWQTGIFGLDWLRDLVKNGRGVDLGGNGYPLEFSAQAADVLPHLVGEPPESNPIWRRDEGDMVTPGRLGKTTKDPAVVFACRPSEWLLIQAWDES